MRVAMRVRSFNGSDSSSFAADFAAPGGARRCERGSNSAGCFSPATRQRSRTSLRICAAIFSSSPLLLALRKAEMGVLLRGRRTRYDGGEFPLSRGRHPVPACATCTRLVWLV